MLGNMIENEAPLPPKKVPPPPPPPPPVSATVTQDRGAGAQYDPLASDVDWVPQVSGPPNAHNDEPGSVENLPEGHAVHWVAPAAKLL